MVVGLDGATWAVLNPLLEEGAMPALASLLDRSARGMLRSTIPPYTPPAWTSAATGVNPGRHGIFGFVQGSVRPTLSHWGLVRSPAVWEYLGRDGRSVGLFHLPLTYPPPAVQGWAVGAVWMPTARGVDDFTHPRDLAERIQELAPGYAPASGVELFRDWQDPGLADQVTSVLRDRFLVLADLLDRRPVDLVWAVLEAPDRLQHAYYKYLDPAEPMSRSGTAEEVRDAARRAFAEMDRIVGLLDGYAGADGVTVVCSDHGATGWWGTVFGNRLLADAGLLRYGVSGRIARAAGIGRLGTAARKVLPARMTYQARRRVQSMLDSSRTLAYTARLGSQGFSVNLAGREPGGSVPAGHREETLQRLATALRAAQAPSGRSLFPAVHRREDLYAGPCVGDAPDLVVESEGSRWEVSDAVGDRGLIRDLSALPLGCHHPDGILSVRGPGVVPTVGVRAEIMDVAPTLLYAMGTAVPEGMEGTARRDLFGPQAPAVRTAPALEPATGRRENPYSEDEEAAITKYLTDLGYLG